jgi:hypothetical protein
LNIPEVGGPIDPDNEAHDLIMSVFGGVSKGERNRIKIRVRLSSVVPVQPCHFRVVKTMRDFGQRCEHAEFVVIRNTRPTADCP